MTATDGALQHDFEAWYRGAWSRLVAAVALDTGSLEAAEDAVAGAAVQALERWTDGSINNADGWVYRVAVNSARRARRRDARPVTVGPGASYDVVGDPDVWRAISTLPVQQRRAVVLRYLLDLTQAQVAEELGVAPGTAAALLHKARTSLKHTREIGRA